MYERAIAVVTVCEPTWILPKGPDRSGETVGTEVQLILQNAPSVSDTVYDIL